MTPGSTYPAHAHRSATGTHRMAWIGSILGILAAMIGAYIALAPDDGSLTFFTGTWTTGELVDTWAPWLLITGGAVAAIGLAASEISDGKNGGSGWLVGAKVLVGVFGIAAIVGGVTLLV